MTHSSSSKAEWQRRLLALQTDGLERKMRIMDGPTGTQVLSDGRVRALFCSNDYLGLADHPDIKAAMKTAVDVWGNGAGASRLVSGNFALHSELEHASARFVNADDAVLFVSGYQANVGAISALVGRGDAVFSDELVHASLIDGARLSRADIHVFRHSDMDHLRNLLRDAGSYRVKLIVTDAVFSMDGDTAKLGDIVSLAAEFDAAVYLDEAHAFGVLGPNGAGLAAALNLSDRVDIRVATYSKALGVSGGFVATRQTEANLIRSCARSLLFTTAPPPPLAAAILKSLDITERAHAERARLTENIQTFKAAARARNLPLLDSESPIQPVLTGSNHRTIAVSNVLFDAGYFVQGIRPPTVPKDKGRLRVTLSAKHDSQTITALVDAIAQAFEMVTP